MHVRSRAARATWPSLFSAISIAATIAGAPHARAQTTDSDPPVPAVITPPVFLNHPTLVDTAHLKSGDTTIALFGIKGWGGDPVQSLQTFLTNNGDRVTCQPHAGGDYICMLPTGIDLAEAALANGAAEAVPDAPASYHQQEAAAQAGHAGMWAALPPVPVTVEQPVVQTTAEIVGNGQVFLLDGLVGFPAQYYTLQLQNYIATHGNRLRCGQQPSDRFVCLLPDGTDIGAVALSNGLARTDTNATGQYRADQAKAIASKSGFWFNPPSEGGTTTTPVITQTPNCCVYPPADTGDGVDYADGVPTAVIDDEPVFLGYAGLLGFGFFDANRQWHAVPEAYRAHLDRFHPGGAGLRSPVVQGGVRPVTAFHAPGFVGARPVLPHVFNGPTRATNAGLLHAPSVIEPQFGAPRGGFRPGAITPLGIGLRPGLGSPRIGIAPFHPVYTPHIAPPAFMGRR